MNNVEYDLLKEVREEQKKLMEKTVEHRSETAKWQVNTSARLSSIEKDLREHKEGVIQNRETLKMYHERLNKLEEPSHVKKFLFDHGVKLFKFIAAAGAAIGVIGKYLDWF